MRGISEATEATGWRSRGSGSREDGAEDELHWEKGKGRALGAGGGPPGEGHKSGLPENEGKSKKTPLWA